MSPIPDPQAALAAALHDLARRDPAIAAMLDMAGIPETRRRDPGLTGLARIVVSQQVSTASAAAIWARVAARFEPLTVEALLDASDDDLRAAGLSRPKIATLRAVSAAIRDGALPLDRLHAMPADEAHALMVAVKGIGPWTADIYLLFCLGHPDAFPSGDLALQEAARIALRLDARPGPRELERIAERWRPARGAAALLLWEFYHVAKRRDGAPLGE